MSLSKYDRFHMQSLWLTWNQRYRGLKGNQSETNEFMSSQYDWNEIKVM